MYNIVGLIVTSDRKIESTLLSLKNDFKYHHENDVNLESTNFNLILLELTLYKDSLWNLCFRSALTNTLYGPKFSYDLLHTKVSFL